MVRRNQGPWMNGFLVACYATLHPAMSVGRSVGVRSIGRFWDFWAYCSCPNALVTLSSTAPARPHATGVAMYPALLHAILHWKSVILRSYFVTFDMEKMLANGERTQDWKVSKKKQGRICGR